MFLGFLTLPVPGLAMGTDDESEVPPPSLTKPKSASSKKSISHKSSNSTATTSEASRKKSSKYLREDRRLVDESEVSSGEKAAEFPSFKSHLGKEVSHKGGVAIGATHTARRDAVVEERCQYSPQKIQKKILLKFLKANTTSSESLDLTAMIEQVGFGLVAYALTHRNEFEGFLDSVAGLQIHIRLTDFNIKKFRNFVLMLYSDSTSKISLIEIKEKTETSPNDILLDEIVLNDIVFLHLKTGIDIVKTFRMPCLRQEILIKEFYKKIQSKTLLKQDNINKLVELACLEARSSDGLPMNLTQALRVLLKFNWAQIDEKYSDLCSVLKESYSKQKVKSETYYSKKDDDLHFYMIKITGRNAHMWEEYALKQRDLAEAYTGEDYSVKKADVGIKGFLPSLSYHDQDSTETWVSFVSNRPWLDKSQIDYPAIEMFISMMTSQRAKFTGHIGITRAASYAGSKHRNLACDLHSFVALVTLKNYTDKVYMINVPAARMREILTQKLFDINKMSGIYIGDNHTEYPSEDLSSLQKRKAQMKKENQDKIDSQVRLFEQTGLAISLHHQKGALERGLLTVPLSVEKSSPNEYLSFKLLNSEGTILNDISPIEMSGEFAWFFESPWFIKNPRHPIVTFNLRTLADLTSFDSEVQYETKTEFIGSASVL